VEKIIEEVLAFPHKPSTEAIQRSIDAFLAHDTAARLSAVTAPTLVLAGGLDMITPPRYGRIVADSIPGARLEVLAEEAHQPFQEAPDLFNAQVDTFWREVEAHGPQRAPLPRAVSRARTRVDTASSPWAVTTTTGKFPSAGTATKLPGGCGRLADRAGPLYTGIHRRNIVAPSTAMATSIPTAVQASDFRLKIRKATQTDSPVAARPRWVKMTGTGSLLRATPWPVTSFSMSQTASMKSPMRTVANQVITVAKPILPPAARSA